MRNFIEEVATCGRSFNTGAVKPIMDTKSSCTVPKGSYVHVGGRVANQADMTGPLYFAWDRVDVGFASYTNTDVPRFVPRFPTQRSSSRFLPNLYLLNYPIDGYLEEIAPKADVPGTNTMTFRFIARTSFDATETIADFDAALAGTFGFKDLALTYSTSDTPLIITSANFASPEQVTVNWMGGAVLTDQVELLVALNTMREVPAFEYEDDVKDLDWIALGVFPNSGSATAVTVPVLSNPDLLPMVLMIRSTDSGDAQSTDCYFFDLISCTSDFSCGGPTTTDPPTKAPTVSPTSAPTKAPVKAPTDPPTKAPVVSPTSAPTNAPEKAPTRAPTSAPTGVLCFSDRTIVQVKNKGATSMDSLMIGDAVLSAGGTYSKVYSFGHYSTKDVTEFLQIHVATVGNDDEPPLEITADHMLYVYNEKAKTTSLHPAGDVQVGYYLITAQGILTQVSSVSKVMRHGAFAPFTLTGDIVVGGVAASNYIALPPVFQDHQLSFELQHRMQHAAYTPYRLFCQFISSSSCQDETYDESSGLSKAVKVWLPLLHWVEMSCTAQAIISVTAQAVHNLWNVVAVAVIIIGAFLVLKSGQHKVVQEKVKGY